MPTNKLTKVKLFPEDMIDEILGRLPPKSVIRFRCLSRLHCSKLVGREFIEHHLRHSLKSEPCETLIISKDGQEVQLFEHHLSHSLKSEPYESYCIIRNGHEFRGIQHGLVAPKVRRLVLPFNSAGHPNCDRAPCPMVRLCGSCHGLIALHFCSNDLVVWNPYTNKHKRLTAPVTENLRPMALGFGYDSITRDYKLVWIDWNTYIPDPERPAEFKVMVYRFKSNTWSEVVRGLADTYFVNIDCAAALFREVLHFSCVKMHYQNLTQEDCILAFNLNTEEFRELAAPPYAPRMLFVDVRVLRGHLCAVYHLDKAYETEVFAVKDYGGKDESWTLLLRVSSTPSISNRHLLDYLDNGRKFLVHKEDIGPVWVDLERKTTETVLRRNPWETPFSRYLEATLMAGTLVSVDAPISFFSATSIY